MTDILNIIRSFELSPAAGIGIESVDRARQIVGRQLGGVLIVLEGDGIKMRRLSPVILKFCQQGVVLLHELLHLEGAGSDRVRRQVLCVLGDNGICDDGKETAVGCIQMNHKCFFIRRCIGRIRSCDLGRLYLLSVLVLIGLVSDRVGLSAGHILVDLVVARDRSCNGLFNGIKNIFHREVAAVVEFHALAQDKGIGLEIITDFIGFSKGGFKASVRPGAHQSFVNVKKDTSCFRCLNGEGVKSGGFRGNTLDEISAFHHLAGRFAAGGFTTAACDQ